MARNLQSKLAPADSIRIFDINQASVQRLAEEMKASQAGGAVVETAGSAYEAAKDSVRMPPPPFATLPSTIQWAYALSELHLAFWSPCHDTGHTTACGQLPSRKCHVLYGVVC